MTTRKAGLQEFALRRPVNFEAEKTTKKDVEVVHANLQTSEPLMLADDQDGGGDPYNSTGQHATLGAKNTS